MKCYRCKNQQFKLRKEEHEKETRTPGIYVAVLSFITSSGSHASKSSSFIPVFVAADMHVCSNKQLHFYSSKRQAVL